VLVAFAATDGTPTDINAGRDTNDPPPANAFMLPANKPTRKRRIISYMFKSPWNPSLISTETLVQNRGRGAGWVHRRFTPLPVTGQSSPSRQEARRSGASGTNLEFELSVALEASIIDAV